MLHHRETERHHSITPYLHLFLQSCLHPSLRQLVYRGEEQRPPSDTQPGTHQDVEATHARAHTQTERLRQIQEQHTLAIYNLQFHATHRRS